jgi:hypothetical protein
LQRHACFLQKPHCAVLVEFRKRVPNPVSP